MTKQFILILLVFCALHANSQSPSWQWAKSVGGTGYETSTSISVDANENVYATGYFGSPTITFGNTVLTNNGGDDIFIVKYDAFGNVAWAKSAGGAASDVGNSISVDANGNSYLIGGFNSSSIVFGNTTLTNDDGSGNSPDIFIVKYDVAGNVLWAKRAGGGFIDNCYGISIDTSGNFYITGGFQSLTVTFDTINLTKTNYVGTDIFIAKYDSLGNALWAKNIGGNNTDIGNGIIADVKGNSYLTGQFQEPIIFGNTTLTNVVDDDIFVVKYDPSGNVLWAKSAGGSSIDEGNSISIDGNGNSIVTGHFYSSSITFGNIILTNDTTNIFTCDIFIVKYDSLGNVHWAKSIGGTNNEVGNSINVDLYGNIYVTGYFQSTSLTFGNTVLTNSGIGYDIFIAKYDASGNLLWAKSAGGADTDFGLSVCVSTTGNSFISGSYRSATIAFDNISLTNAGNNTDDIFVAKLNDLSTSIAQEFESSGFKLYPNPFTTETVLQTEIILKGATLNMYNLFGQQVKQIKNISGQTIALRRDNLPSGLYFIRLTQDNKVIATDKLIITD